MKAIVRDRYGSADVLQLRDVDVPEVGVDEVLVRVHAAGIDRGAWHIMAGLPYLIRLVGYGVRRPKAAGRQRSASCRRSMPMQNCVPCLTMASANNWRRKSFPITSKLAVGLVPKHGPCGILG